MNPTPADIVAAARMQDIPGFPGYRVGDDGSVWCCLGRGGLRGRKTEEWRKLKPKRQQDGRLHIGLYKNRIRRVFAIHRLVLCVFVGPCPLGMEASHLNDDCQDNRLSNLAWETPEENTKRRQENGKYARGSTHHQAILSEQEVLWIRRNYPRMTMAALAKKFGVSEPTIWQIVHRGNWKHLRD